MKKTLFILDWSSPENDQLRYVFSVTDSKFLSNSCPIFDLNLVAGLSTYR